MSNNTYLWRLTKVIITVGLVEMTIGLPAALANPQTPITPTTEVENLEPMGSASDLQGIDTYDLTENSWGVGGESPISPAEATTTAPESSSFLRQQQENQEWQNTNRGEPANSGGTIPLTQF